MDMCAELQSHGRRDGGERSSLCAFCPSLAEDTVQAWGWCGEKLGVGAGGACFQDCLYSLCFHGTLASEGENTYQSAAIDLLRQTNSYVCYTKGLLTSLRLEAEGGGERRSITPLGRELMGWWEREQRAEPERL